MGLADRILNQRIPTRQQDYNGILKVIVSELTSINSNIEIYIFGSVANNQCYQDSDLDIFVVLGKAKTQKFKPEFAFKLRKIAKDDLYAAEVLSKAPGVRIENIVYHIQQCIEKTIKAALVNLSIPVPLSHDLEVLVGLLPDNFTKSLPSGLGELTQFATLKRYTDGDELIDETDIQELLKLGLFFLNWCDSIIGENK